MIGIETNHRPVYCRECRSHNSFEPNPSGDVKTESGQAFMLSWKCRVCGHTTSMTNPDYVVPSKQAESKEVIEDCQEELEMIEGGCAKQ